MNPTPPSPDPKFLIKSMQYVSVLAELFNCTIDLMFCEFDLSYYSRLDVSEESFSKGDGFSMVDYVPISPTDLIELKGLGPRAMLHQIQTISKGRHCIVTTRGEAEWAERVFYPHT